MDAGQLRVAYERFFDIAEHGGFKAPAPGEWSATEILAHVAFNDVLMADVTEALARGEDPAGRTYDEAAVSDPAVLDALVAGRRYADVLMLARENAERLLSAVTRLSDTAAERLVPARIGHENGPVPDAPVPWSAVVVAQAQQHLPTHTEQLEALCV